MHTSKIVRASSPDRAAAMIIGSGVIAAQGLYFFFYAPAIARADFFKGMNTLWLKVHIDLYWTSYFLLFASLVLTLFLILKHTSTRFPWVEVATMVASAFALIGLVTGILFAKSAWGAYWVWDAKLTSVLLSTPVLIGISVFAMVVRTLLSPTARNVVLLLLLTIAVGLCAEWVISGFWRVMHPQWLIPTLLGR